MTVFDNIKQHPLTSWHAWFDTALGSSLLNTEMKESSHILSKLHGEQLVKIDGPASSWLEFLAASKIKNKTYLTANLISANIIQAGDTQANTWEKASVANDTTANAYSAYVVQCHYHALPLFPESVDVVVIHHALEFASNPRAILEEAQQILAPGGHLIIFGFNPLSLFGLRRLLALNILSDRNGSNGDNNDEISNTSTMLQPPSPWHGRFISSRRLKDWLEQLYLTQLTISTFYFRPPYNSSELLKKFAFLEKLGGFFHLPCGACYMMVAQKTVAGIIPLRYKSLTSARDISFSYLKPSPQVNRVETK